MPNEIQPTSTRSRYIMIGGFLGAGKTTAVAALAKHLSEQGERVGLITNDQSTNLVDTTILRARGFAVEEIAGGCFCCRFDSLSAAAENLTRETQPDIFIAEPVGSCTDLIATVSYPLRRMYGDRFVIAPLSVLVDPARAARILGLDPGRSFSEKVAYVYRKQLEEASLILINKCDTISLEQQETLQAKLANEYPNAKILRCSAAQGDGLDEWFELLQSSELATAATMSVDYATYAEGESLLGWLNCTVRVKAQPGNRSSDDHCGNTDSDETVDGNTLLTDLTADIARQLEDSDHEIAHLKMTLDSPDAGGSLSVVSLVTTGAVPDLRESLLDRVEGGTLTINLRAEAEPELLQQVTIAALAKIAEDHNCSLTMEHSEFFRPGKPVPQHRDRVPA